MKNDALARHRRRQTSAGCRLFAALTASAITFLAVMGLGQTAQAGGDGTLEDIKGGLFHRKGFIFPEIHQRRNKSNTGSTASSGSQSTVRVASSTSTTPTQTSTRKTGAKSQPRKRRLPQRAVKRREQKVARTKSRSKKPVRVASLTPDVPSSSSSKRSTKSVTGGSARIHWAASSRCVPSRLRSAIAHVARNYGRVRVNSTCRSRRHNRRVGGASRSYHLKSQAADLRVFGNIRAAARYLRGLGGGYKHYGGGLFHIDTGPRRTW